nr:hypothetical protein [uncultured Tateyamaria sp.]
MNGSVHRISVSAINGWGILTLVIIVTIVSTSIITAAVSTSSVAAAAIVIIIVSFIPIIVIIIVVVDIRPTAACSLFGFVARASANLTNGDSVVTVVVIGSHQLSGTVAPKGRYQFIKAEHSVGIGVHRSETRRLTKCRRRRCETDNKRKEQALWKPARANRYVRRSNGVTALCVLAGSVHHSMPDTTRVTCRVCPKSSSKLHVWMNVSHYQR